MTEGGLAALHAALRKTAQEAIIDIAPEATAEEIQEVADRIENTIVEIIDEKASEELDDLREETMRAEEMPEGPELSMMPMEEDEYMEEEEEGAEEEENKEEEEEGFEAEEAMGPMY